MIQAVNDNNKYSTKGSSATSHWLHLKIPRELLKVCLSLRSTKKKKYRYRIVMSPFPVTLLGGKYCIQKALLFYKSYYKLLEFSYFIQKLGMGVDFSLSPFVSLVGDSWKISANVSYTYKYKTTYIFGNIYKNKRLFLCRSQIYIFKYKKVSDISYGRTIWWYSYTYKFFLVQ